MTTVRLVPRFAGCATILAAATLCAGCAEELGPVPMPVTRVWGSVREGGRPVPGGWIEFIPVDGTVGNLRSARLGPDGAFDADGVAVGENAIRLANAGIQKLSYPYFLFGTYSSPIRRAIRAGSSAQVTIELDDEAVKFQQTMSRVRAGTPSTAGEGP